MRLLSSILLTLLTAGCASKGIAPPTQATAALSASVGAADARTDAVLDIVGGMQPDNAKLLATKLLAKVKLDFAAMVSQIEKNRVNEKLMDGTINNQKTDIAVRDAWQKYVDTWWLGPRTWRAIHWIWAGAALLFAGWLFAGFASMYAPAIWGLKGIAISKVIIRFLPLGGLFSGRRDKIAANALGLVPGYVPKKGA